MKKVIYLNAGHSEVDPGANVPNNRYEYESQLNMAIRDFVVPELLDQGFKVISISDHLNLSESILGVNLMTSWINDGLALDIHCNKSPRGYEGSKNGAEAYHYDNHQFSKDIAQKLVDEYCRETDLNNRGALSDSKTFFKSLGWIRRTNIWATLIECGYLDNEKDLNFLINNLDKVARGIAKGVCKIYNIKYIEKLKPDSEINRKSQAFDKIIKIVQEYGI